MKYSASQYANAFVDVLAALPPTEVESATKRFAALIEKNGDSAHANAIIDAVLKHIVRGRGGRWVEVEYARAEPARSEAELRRFFSKEDHTEISINPALIAGLRIIIDGEREYDNSFRRRISKMFS